MNNTEKLLRAFIEASGYEIEEVHTKTYGHPRSLTGAEKGFGGVTVELEFQGDGLYKEVTRNVDYKVIKGDASNQKSWSICDKCNGTGSHIYAKSHCDCSKCDASGKVYHEKDTVL